MLFGSRGSGWRLEAAGRSGGVRSIGWATGVVSCSLTSGAGEDEGSPCFVQPFILQSEAVLFFGASRGWWSSDAARDFGEETEWRLRVMPMWPFSLVGVRGVYASVEVECEKERSGSLIERAWRTGGSGGLVAGAFEAAWKGIAGEPRPGGRRACKKHRSQIRSRARREGSAAILPCVRCDRCFLAPRVRPLRPHHTHCLLRKILLPSVTVPVISSLPILAAKVISASTFHPLPCPGRRRPLPYGLSRPSAPYPHGRPCRLQTSVRIPPLTRTAKSFPTPQTSTRVSPSWELICPSGYTCSGPSFPPIGNGQDGSQTENGLLLCLAG